MRIGRVNGQVTGVARGTIMSKNAATLGRVRDDRGEPDGEQAMLSPGRGFCLCSLIVKDSR